MVSHVVVVVHEFGIDMLLQLLCCSDVCHTGLAIVCVDVSVDSLLDGIVEDVFGLLSCPVHPWIKSRIGAYITFVHVENDSLLTLCSVADRTTVHSNGTWNPEEI